MNFIRGWYKRALASKKGQPFRECGRAFVAFVAEDSEAVQGPGVTRAGWTLLLLVVPDEEVPASKLSAWQRP